MGSPWVDNGSPIWIARRFRMDRQWVLHGKTMKSRSCVLHKVSAVAHVLPIGVAHALPVGNPWTPEWAVQ